MQHCTKPIFASDKFCEDCGKEVAVKNQRSTVEEISPDILTELKVRYPRSSIVTGMITNLYLYKRKYVTKESHLIFSFWYLTLVTNQGETLELSVDAETTLGANLNKGDVISLLQPTLLSLNHKLESKAFKTIINNNDYADYIVIHAQDKQYKIKGNDYDVSRQSKPIYTFFVTCFVALFSFITLNYSIDTVINLTIAAMVITFIIEWTIKNNKYKKHLLDYEALSKTFDALSQISISELGYENLQRVKQDDDVICVSCQQRISIDSDYCFCCGIAQKNAITPPNDNVSLLTTPQDKAITATSIAEIEKSIKATYSSLYQTPFIFNNLVSKSFTGTMNFESILGKVVSKNTSASTSDVTTTSTTTAYNSSGYKADSSESRHRLRQSDLQGQIVLSTADGFLTLSLPEKQMIATDVGDWFLYQDCMIDTDCGKQNRFQILFYNVTKKLHYDVPSIQISEFNAKEGGMIGLMYTLAFFSCLGFYAAGTYPLLEFINGKLGAPLNDFFLFISPSIMLIFMTVIAEIKSRSLVLKSCSAIDNAGEKNKQIRIDLFEDEAELRRKLLKLS